jgi:hypothetical protein
MPQRSRALARMSSCVDSESARTDSTTGRIREVRLERHVVMASPCDSNGPPRVVRVVSQAVECGFWLSRALVAVLGLTHASPAGAGAPNAKTFVISGAPPIEGIVVDALAKDGASGNRFTGTAVLRLLGSSPLALKARLDQKPRKHKARYQFILNAGRLPAFPRDDRHSGLTRRWCERCDSSCGLNGGGR